MIVEEPGHSVPQVQVEEGDTDTPPDGLGTYASRSTQTAAGTMDARRTHERATKIANL